MLSGRLFYFTLLLPAYQHVNNGADKSENYTEDCPQDFLSAIYRTCPDVVNAPDKNYQNCEVNKIHHSIKGLG